MDNFLINLKNGEKKGKIRDNVLVKRKDGDNIYYGLKNHKGELVSYLALIKFSEGLYQVSRSATDFSNQQQGWITALFDYAIGNDKLKIVSDETQTPKARKTWASFKRNNRFSIYIFDPETGEKTKTKLDGGSLKSIDGNIDPYSDEFEEKYLLLAESEKSELLSESFNAMNKARYAQGKWQIIWYGPEIKDPAYFNP